MKERTPGQINKGKGWQKLARATYRLRTEVGEVTGKDERALQLERMLDDTSEDGKRIRRGHGSASEGIQPGDPARIEMRDDDAGGRNPEERAARRIIDAPSKDHLSE